MNLPAIRDGMPYPFPWVLVAGQWHAYLSAVFPPNQRSYRMKCGLMVSGATNGEVQGFRAPCVPYGDNCCPDCTAAVVAEKLKS